MTATWEPEKRPGRAHALACLFSATALLVGDATPGRAAGAAAPTQGKDEMSEARAVSVAYIEAVGTKRFERVSELLHPDLEELARRSNPAR